jgi:hypothetical protein
MRIDKYRKTNFHSVCQLTFYGIREVVVGFLGQPILRIMILAVSTIAMPFSLYSGVACRT